MALKCNTWEDFEKIVDDELKNKANQEEFELLRQPENLEDWLDVLLSTKKKIEAQLSLNKAELEDFKQKCLEKGESGKQEFFKRKTEMDKWRSSANFIKANIEDRILEIKRIKRGLKDTNMDLKIKSQLWELCNKASTFVEDDKWQEEFLELKAYIKANDLI